MATFRFSRFRPLFSPESKFSNRLKTYFRSGWAFFIPYLAAYVLYAWLNGPVNPGPNGEDSPAQGARYWAPCLLQIYWALHAIHLLFAAIALVSWWQDKRQELTNVARLVNHHSVIQSFGYSLVPKAAPWLLLALLFWIPGIYREWPSDPWEHLRRINEWHTHETVTTHSSWKKSSYFIPYSLTQHVTGLTQLGWLNLYYTAVCMLLSWQYYRLARAVGIGPRKSFVFVLLTALTLGNNVFSFHRYYGLSSSIVAQLAAIALIRVVLEAAKSGYSTSGHELSPCQIVAPRCSRRRSATACALLLTLIAYNHIQGIGIAGLGVAAIVLWRLMAWKSALWVLTALAAVMSIVAVLWFPRHPALDAVYRPQGWLNSWYAFNLFTLSSPAAARVAEILGAFGFVNLLVGVWLVIKQNHVVGWITLIPFVMLGLPCFALPLAHVIASQTYAGNIVTFHRFLLAAPAGLALLTLGSQRTYGSQEGNSPGRRPSLALVKLQASVCCGLVLLDPVIPSSGVALYNRFWHSVSIEPDDARLSHHVNALPSLTSSQTEARDTLRIGTPLRNETLNVFQPNHGIRECFRQVTSPFAAESLESKLSMLAAISPDFTFEPNDSGSIRSDQLQFESRLTTPSESVLFSTTAWTNWTTLGGGAPESEQTKEKLPVGNRIGESSHLFAESYIPISLYRRYRLTITVRGSGDPRAINYLAVAWYDSEKNLLPSHEASPMGAGTPSGWINGTYSYFGLVASPAPRTWKGYSISFGVGELAAVPANASFVRVGGLLNYSAVANAKVEIKEIELVEQPTHSHLTIFTQGYWHLYTHASQAAILSSHWPPQHVPMAHAGTAELCSVLLSH